MELILLVAAQTVLWCRFVAEPKLLMLQLLLNSVCTVSRLSLPLTAPTLGMHKTRGVKEGLGGHITRQVSPPNQRAIPCHVTQNRKGEEGS